MPLLAPINPESVAPPGGYSNGMEGTGELVFVAGQIGWNRAGHLVSDDLVAQFAQALDNVLDVVWAAGGRPESVARLVLYVTTKQESRDRAKAIGEAYRHRMGKHFPAMTLVEGESPLEDDARGEAEARGPPW